jgi:hypothetical protein
MHLLLKSLDTELQEEGGLPQKSGNQTQQRAKILLHQKALE